MKIVNNTFSVSENIINSTIVNNFYNFLSKIDEIAGEIPENVNKNIGNPSIIHKLQTSITPCKIRNSKKSFSFHILRWRGFLMIPLTTLYDQYIDRSKLTEQKKPI